MTERPILFSGDMGDAGDGRVGMSADTFGCVVVQTLGDALPREMARVRDEVLPVYLSFASGLFAATLIRASLDAAAKALAEGDIVAMLRAYDSLKGYEL